MASSSILYHNLSRSLFLVDLPKSIEVAQGPGLRQQLLSSQPLQQPFPSTEPKSEKARNKLPQAAVEDLLLQKWLQISLDELKDGYQGQWCQSRVSPTQSPALGQRRKGNETQITKKRLEEELPSKSPMPTELILNESMPELGVFYQNPTANIIKLESSHSQECFHIPPNSTVLQGSIQSTVAMFIQHAPRFSLMVLDPPWPNRSARRKNDYNVYSKNPEIHMLLESIPIRTHLADGGLVAVWVTNKTTYREMILNDGGLFEFWGLTLIEEWTWLKVTNNGDPIYTLNGVWRKPYEILLVGKHSNALALPTEEVKRRILVGVPDMHSRKPNLKEIFEKTMSRSGDGEKHEAIEVFARNLTAGWWAWGNEALKFQGEEYWDDNA